MALLGNLQTTDNSATAAEVHSPGTDGTSMEGVGSPGSPFKVKDLGISTAKIAANAVTNAKLAAMASKRYKGRTTASTGDPEDLTAAQMQADLSIDDLITLSGRPEGSTDLGTFTGSTIPDNSDIKEALQALETGLASAGGSAAYDSLTSGSFTALCTRLGSSAITISSPATGEFTLTIPLGVDLERADLFTSSASVNASLETIVRIDNSANSRARRVSIVVILANTGSEETVLWTQTVTTNVTTITLPGMNGNGTNGYRILIN